MGLGFFLLIRGLLFITTRRFLVQGMWMWDRQDVFGFINNYSKLSYAVLVTWIHIRVIADVLCKTDSQERCVGNKSVQTHQNTPCTHIHGEGVA